MSVFLNYQWPGNIRQLRNVIERAVVLSKGNSLKLTDLPEELCPSGEKLKTKIIGNTLKQREYQAIKDALQSCNGNKSKVSRALGISRKALYKRLREIQDTSLQ
jgi:transcriptional regulator of acetoin/glycerol metabolism